MTPFHISSVPLNARSCFSRRPRVRDNAIAIHGRNNTRTSITMRVRQIITMVEEARGGLVRTARADFVIIEYKISNQLFLIIRISQLYACRRGVEVFGEDRSGGARRPAPGAGLRAVPVPNS